MQQSRVVADLVGKGAHPVVLMVPRGKRRTDFATLRHGFEKSPCLRDKRSRCRPALPRCPRRPSEASLGTSEREDTPVHPGAPDCLQHLPTGNLTVAMPMEMSITAFTVTSARTESPEK